MESSKRKTVKKKVKKKKANSTKKAAKKKSVVKKTAKRVSKKKRIIYSREELADILSCTKRNIGYLIEKDLPQLEDGGFDVEVCIKWYDEYKKKPKEYSDLEHESLRLKIERMEFENKERMGLYVLKEDVKKAGFEAARQTRDTILNVPGRISDQLAVIDDPSTIHKMLMDELTLALEGLATDK